MIDLCMVLSFCDLLCIYSSLTFSSLAEVNSFIQNDNPSAWGPLVLPLYRPYLFIICWLGTMGENK